MYGTTGTQGQHTRGGASEELLRELHRLFAEILYEDLKLIRESGTSLPVALGRVIGQFLKDNKIRASTEDEMLAGLEHLSLGGKNYVFDDEDEDGSDDHSKTEGSGDEERDALSLPLDAPEDY